MLKIGFVDYINSYPLNNAFRQHLISPSADLKFSIPSRLNSMMQAGELDASFISTKEYLDRKESSYDLIPGFGIAAYNEILSVNLYHKGSLEELDGARVGLTHHSTTSVTLLKVLCHHFWQISPQFEILNRSSPLTDYRGVLLIGDEALLNLEIPGFTTVDLAKSWHDKTGLPFVFAVMARQKNLSSEKESVLAKFIDELGKSLAWGESHSKEIEAIAKKNCDLPLALIKRYYQVCHYRLKKPHLEAISLFSRLFNEIPSYHTQNHPSPV